MAQLEIANSAKSFGKMEVLEGALGSNETAPVEGKVGSRIVVEVPAETDVRLDEVVGLDREPEAAHLFAAATEQRLAA